MGFEELRAFLRVVQEGSFAAAATRLGLPRTTLRRHVDSLEARTGVTLLERSTKGIVLTEAGRRLAASGRLMEQEFTTLLGTLRESLEQPMGELRLLVPTGMPPNGMTVLFGMAQSNWPGVRVHLRFLDEPQTVASSEVDLAFWFGDQGPEGAWETRTFAHATQRLLASSSYLERRGTPRTVEDLSAHALFSWVGFREAAPALIAADGTRVPIGPNLVTPNIHFLHELAHADQGIVWVPDGGLPPSGGHAPLVPLLDDQFRRDVPLRMGAPRMLAELPKVKVFLQSISEMHAFLYTQLGAPMFRREG